MPALIDRIPKYRCHKYSGSAIVTLHGVEHYLGPRGSQVSRDHYDRLIGEWLARGRRAPSSAPSDSGLVINNVLLAFWEHAQTYYRRLDGSPTSEVDNFRQALRPLRQLYGLSLAIEFGPKALKAVREQMIANPGEIDENDALAS